MNLIETNLRVRQRLLRSGAILSCFVLGLMATAIGAAQTERAPAGWFLAGSQPASYRTGVDRTLTPDGKPSAYLQATVPEPNGFGTLMQSIKAESFAGKRVRLRASVMSQDVRQWAGLWMRIDRGHKVVGFDNMQNRAIKGNQPWATYDVVLDVPQDSTAISFGILLTGSGEVWMRDVSVEEVDATAPVTGEKQPTGLAAHPVNLDFTE